MFVLTPSTTKEDSALSILLIADSLSGAWTTSFASIGSNSIVTESPSLAPESTLIPGPEGGRQTARVPVEGRNPLFGSSA